MRIPGRLHTGYEVQGPHAFFYRGSIYHYDFVYHGEQQRKEKVRQYEIISPEKSGSHHYSLPDEASLITHPIPADDAPADGYGANRPPAAREPVRDVDLAEIDRAAVRGCEYGPGLFRARLDCVDCPRVMEAGRWYKVDVDLRNDSLVAFTRNGAPEVRITTMVSRWSLYATRAGGRAPAHLHAVRRPVPAPSPLRAGRYISVGYGSSRTSPGSPREGGEVGDWVASCAR